MKNIVVLVVLGIVLTLGVFGFLWSKDKSNIETINKNEVPLPQETDIINTFFQLINETKISEAVMMMNPLISKDESMKQAWGVQLNAFKKIEVLKIEPSIPEQWTETKHTYKLTAETEMKPEAVEAPIPNYGWENGTNIKWIDIEKIDDKWHINGIASGP